MTHAFLSCSFALLIVGCTQLNKSSPHLVLVKRSTLARYAESQGLRGKVGQIWNNPSGTVIFVEEYNPGPADIYLIKRPKCDIEIVKREGRDRLYFDDAGHVVGWTKPNKPEVFLRDGTILPIVDLKRALVGIDGTATYFYAYDWILKRGYVAALDNPKNILFQISEQPYLIWHNTDHVFLACASTTNNDTSFISFERRATNWQEVAKSLIPGTVSLVDWTSNVAITSREFLVPTIRRYSLFDLVQGRSEPLPSSVPAISTPLFLTDDWIGKNAHDGG